MFVTGNMYYFGTGTDQNLQMAFEWYKKAAEAGMPVAQFRVGELYEDGQGVEADHARAVVWMRKAAGAGEQLAVEWLQAMGEPVR